MPETDTPQDMPFNLDKLLELIEIMEKHGLTEISLKRGNEKWRLRRGSDKTAPPFAERLPSAPASSSPAVNVSPASAEAAIPPKSDGSVTINSPTVGTFYASPTPDDPPFVRIGSTVQPETVVCIMEAMKVFNQIPAEVSGTIVEVLVKNGDSVEFGQPLFRVRPA